MSDRLEPESMLTMPGIGVQLGRNAHSAGGVLMDGQIDAPVEGRG